MKDLLRIILAALAITSMVSCSEKNDVPNQNETLYDLSQVRVVSEGRVYAREYIERQLANLQQSNDLDDELAAAYDEFLNGKLEEVDEIEKQMKEDAGETENGVNTMLSYEYVVLEYMTFSPNGDGILCSELVVWPWGALWNPRPDNVVIGCHCTITDDFSRPSNYENQGITSDVAMLAMMTHVKGDYNLVIIPDYEGYGSSVDRPHPYCYREATAWQVCDGVRAGISYYEHFKKTMEPDWRAVSVGYSQGGAVAAGVYRYAQENDKRLRVVGAVCGDGPYDPISTLQQYIKDGKLYMPVAAALILKGALDTSYELKKLKSQYWHFCTDAFIVSGIFDRLEEKYLNTDAIHKELLAYASEENSPFVMYCWDNKSESFVPYNHHTANSSAFDFDLSSGKAKSYAPIDQCFKQGVIDYFQGKPVTPGEVDPDKLDALKHFLEKNSLLYGGWAPSAKSGMTFFHSTRDEVVPVCNLDMLDSWWLGGHQDGYLAYWYETSTYLHVGTGKAFYLYYADDYVNKIFKDKWKPGRYEIKGGLFQPME